MLEQDVEGIVLSKQAYGDAHRFYDILTAEQGRIRCWAPSARGSKRRGLGALDVFVTARFEIRFNRLHDVGEQIQTAQMVVHRQALRRLPQGLGAGLLILLCCKALIPEYAPASQAYLHVTQGLDALAREDAHGLFVCWQLLVHAGQAPDVECCHACHRPWRQQAVYLGGEGQLDCGCGKTGRVDKGQRWKMPPAVLSILRKQACVTQQTLLPFATWMTYHIASLHQQPRWFHQAQACLDVIGHGLHPRPQVPLGSQEGWWAK